MANSLFHLLIFWLSFLGGAQSRTDIEERLFPQLDKFKVQDASDYERCAIVREDQWQEWMTKLSRAFFTIEDFEKDEGQQAWTWLRQNGEPQHLW